MAMPNADMRAVVSAVHTRGIRHRKRSWRVISPGVGAVLTLVAGVLFVLARQWILGVATVPVALVLAGEALRHRQERRAAQPQLVETGRPDGPFSEGQNPDEA